MSLNFEQTTQLFRAHFFADKIRSKQYPSACRPLATDNDNTLYVVWSRWLFLQICCSENVYAVIKCKAKHAYSIEWGQVKYKIEVENVLLAMQEPTILVSHDEPLDWMAGKSNAQI